MRQYNHKQIEKKWQNKWNRERLYETKENEKKEKCYVLDMFPYPSGEGLHVGHPKGYIASDIYARFKRMQGHTVLHPMGWDAFGLPAENFALKNKTHPKIAVKKNIKRFKEQLNKIGFSYDWGREINTTDPEYYKWTQWIFLRLFENGLAYQSDEPINWCPSCKTGLANEDLEGDTCERCGSVVEKKPMRQWMLKIREYADRLLEDIDDLKWPESVKESQRNWIGRSEGWEIEFKIQNSKFKIPIFTTRPDTLFGATFLVLSPEHPLLANDELGIKNYAEVRNYIKKAKNKTEIERTAMEKGKTGVLLEGVKAINPGNGDEIPIWIADYVLASYGTGAIMAVPAHDERDFQFAKKFGLPIKEVVSGGNTLKSAYTSDGALVNSGKFDGMPNKEGGKKIGGFIGGKKKIIYKLRDWVFSRQRYWGEPIPLIFCEACKKSAENHKPQITNSKQIQNSKFKIQNRIFTKGELLNHGWVAVPEKDLPVKLPNVTQYEPAGTGDSPLANIENWVKTKCPKCGGKARRETNTMPQWAGSSWYYLRFIDPHNRKVFVDKKKEEHWSPVDMYIGGVEHATRHLIYARFWHKFLYDIGVVNYKEPFVELRNQGLINGEDGRKMSKRWGNIINPDDIVDLYGADTLRVYEMFMGPFEDAISWSTQNIIGSRRFLERIWKLHTKVNPHTQNAVAVKPRILGVGVNPETNDTKLENLLHKTIKKVTEDIQTFRFNTAVSSLMIFVNELEKCEKIPASLYSTLLLLVAPFVPHMADELWSFLGHIQSIYNEPWPCYDAEKIKDEVCTIVVQIDGKVRTSFSLSCNEEEELVIKKAVGDSAVQKWIAGKAIKKTFYIKRKLVSIVTD